MYTEIVLAVTAVACFLTDP